MKKDELVDKLFSLVERDHGGCNDNSCDIGLALKHGFDAIAINQWAGCGASDSEFDKLYTKLPESYTSYSPKSEYRRQINEFCGFMHTRVCPVCNAHCRDEYEAPAHCDSCLADLTNVKELE